MRERWVHVEHDFAAPVGEVFSHLAEHENLAAVFGAKVERVRDGETERNGTGSVRRLRIGPLPPFEETVTAFVPDELIEYRITRGSPLKGHIGTMRFSERPGGGTHLDYRIRIASAIPGLAPVVAAGLSRNVAKGLRGVPGGA
jgi:uncharacterized protein YndB with AHSA1/START domain